MIQTKHVTVTKTTKFVMFSMIRKEFFIHIMIEIIKGIIGTINQMIVALVEFDYEEALEEMKKNN
ncbi:hypothetical protein [Bacillus sp. V2I10]|uniref:hypothetical protein n=1 Tax=Bacillus sp. V2I10 TaxID=3042276 RepID=UPI002786B557|nr:hypothetical protein [Bacillus sp. V2I10]MDQ0860001.1 hypothetical protein [Bacillus sp. V2I10]